MPGAYLSTPDKETRRKSSKLEKMECLEKPSLSSSAVPKQLCRLLSPGPNSRETFIVPQKVDVYQLQLYKKTMRSFWPTRRTQI
ncbi:unnamed protein product, partial [Mesorhabditis belari]|uniref:Uncharacterized protein n=1 Tax=Mesorhabditis belari TaxID=2138241 RepID=A0AAF3F6E6_9BILA